MSMVSAESAMSDMTLLVAVLVAGASRRLGTSKQLLRIDGEPVLRRQCRVALAADVGAVVAVVGCQAVQCAEVIADLRVGVCVNTEWSEGMASSLRVAATAALERDTDGLLLLPCDQYRMTPLDPRALHAVWQQAGGACVSRYLDQTRPPAIIPADCYGRVRVLRGDTGARPILFDPQRARPLEVDSPRAAFDLDRPSDLMDYMAHQTPWISHPSAR
jgi:molybdenum cofactor cytidylyltransferase